MKTLASCTAHSTASPAAFFAKWVDHASWNEWSPDCEWVRVEGEVVQGAHGELKPTSGPKVKFEITALRPDREYTDTSSLPGAALVFRHLATERAGGTDLSVSVTMSGPLTFFWSRIMGRGFAESAPADLARLVDLVERSMV